MDTLEQYVDFLVTAFHRKMSPRIDAKERLIRLVEEHYAHLSGAERSAIVWLVLMRFQTLTVVRQVPHHSMRLRSHV
jgi:hypothetical protein